MQKFATLAVLALCLLAVNTQAADGPHSTIKDAKVGDWVEYKITAGTGGRNIEMTSKQTCTARDETSVTEKKEMTVMGHSNSMEVKIDLTKEYNPANPTGNGKAEIVDQGDEVLSIGGKEYKCHWMQVKSAVDQGGQPGKFEGKIWVSQDVPLGGMVKMEGKSDSARGQGDFKMELTGSGSK